MTQYREILRLHSMELSQADIAASCGASKKTVNKVLKAAKEHGVFWPLDDSMTDAALDDLLFPRGPKVSPTKQMPDFDYIHKELLRNGVNKKLLWTEYLEACRQNGGEPLMYSQFCYYIQQDEQRRRAAMHIARKPGEQIEVDWAGDTARILDPDTGETTKAYVFVGVLSYSQYPYVEAFINEQQSPWITAHIHMFEYFGGVSRILVPDNCKTAVIHNGEWNDPQVNAAYHEMAEHYNCAIVPARVRAPKDKPNAEGSVGVISTWIIAALRDEQFFSLAELNAAIRVKLNEFSHKAFQKKDGTRYDIFMAEEFPVLTPLPPTRYELAEWKQATVQFNYHIAVDNMYYSVPHEYIKRKVDVRVTASTIEVFYKQTRIATHRRLFGRKGQYSTDTAHMPEDHQKYLEWNGDRFRRWGAEIGPSTATVVNAVLASQRVEQQSYRSCMGLLKLADKYSPVRLENACTLALSYTASPSYKNVKDILAAGRDKVLAGEKSEHAQPNPYALTRGSDYYRR